MSASPRLFTKSLVTPNSGGMDSCGLGIVAHLQQFNKQQKEGVELAKMFAEVQAQQTAMNMSEVEWLGGVVVQWWQPQTLPHERWKKSCHDSLSLHQIPKPDPKPTTSYKRRIQSTKTDASGKVLKSSTTKLPGFLGNLSFTFFNLWTQEILQKELVKSQSLQLCECLSGKALRKVTRDVLAESPGEVKRMDGRGCYVIIFHVATEMREEAQIWLYQHGIWTGWDGCYTVTMTPWHTPPVQGLWSPKVFS